MGVASHVAAAGCTLRHLQLIGSSTKPCGRVFDRPSWCVEQHLFQGLKSHKIYKVSARKIQESSQDVDGYAAAGSRVLGVWHWGNKIDNYTC